MVGDEDNSEAHLNTHTPLSGGQTNDLIVEYSSSNVVDIVTFELLRGLVMSLKWMSEAVTLV